MNLLQIREKQNDLLFNGKAEFDSFELSEMLSRYTAFETAETSVSDAASDILKSINDQKKAIGKMKDKLDLLLELAEINNLPDAFIQTYKSETEKLKNELDDIYLDSDEVHSIAGGLSDTFSNVGFYE